VRSREYLTAAEVDCLRKAARGVGRHGFRNDTMILLAYRHGLRVSELIHLRWDQLDLDQGLLHVRRLQQGVPSTHPFTGGEMRALRRLKSRAPADAASVFLSERKGPLTAASVRKMIAQAGERAALGFPVHPHQLRHSCGFKLANDTHDTRAIQLFLGHRTIQHTVKYTALAAGRFQDFWRDEDSADLSRRESDPQAVPRTLINSLEPCLATLAYFLGDTEVSPHRLCNVDEILPTLRTHPPAFTGFLRASV
jgi:type 1 fimbriae regulatory protein FimB/type 1 fimbriae regulatory protein FimE